MFYYCSLCRNWLMGKTFRGIQFLYKIFYSRRNERLFWVSRSTSTSVLSTTTVCFTGAATVTACTRRRRNIETYNSGDKSWETTNNFQTPVNIVGWSEDLDIEPSHVQQVSGSEADLEPETEISERAARFLMYWTTSTKVSTSTSYTVTSILGTLECTPSNFAYSSCG